jgi:(4S)-4-hydroxy-5-phosphonooxypentane-2,3-dione isomerase
VITLIARWHVKPGHVEEVLDGLRRMAPLVAEQEPDCHAYHANRSLDDPNLILLYERYTDLDAIEAHRETEYFKEIVGGIIFPLLEHRERELYDAVLG